MCKLDYTSVGLALLEDWKEWDWLLGKKRGNFEVLDWERDQAVASMNSLIETDDWLLEKKEFRNWEMWERKSMMVFLANCKKEVSRISTFEQVAVRLYSDDIATNQTENEATAT